MEDTIEAVRLRQRIVKARSDAGFSQSYLAERIGIESTAVSKIETGARSVSSTELAAIAKACGRPLMWFFSEDDTQLSASLRADGLSSEALNDLAWASELTQSYSRLVALTK